MNHELVYYSLGMKGLYALSLSKAAKEQGLQTWMCSYCRSPQPWIKSIDVTIQQQHPPKRPLNIVSGPRLGVAHREFLAEFGKEVLERDLYLGRVFNEDGDECVDYATFRGRHRVIVRGVQDARNETCPECGCNLYFALHSKTHSYLYPKPPVDAEIFGNHGSGLVVSEKIKMRLTSRWRKGFSLTKLRVLDVPLDGFTDLRSLYEERPLRLNSMRQS